MTLRGLWRGLVVLALPLAARTTVAQAVQGRTASQSTAATAIAAVGVVGVPTVGMTVSDMERSIAFYRDVLTFRVVSDVEVVGDALEELTGVFGARVRVVRLRLADEMIELTQYIAPRGRPIPDDARSNDRDFQHVAIIVRDMDAVYARLRGAKVEHASTGPQRLPDWNPNAGGIKAFYFKDPDRHVLEVLEFPRGKGDARWHRSAGDTLFLGIDHTAIVAADTDVSLAFYRDVLGMRVVGASENSGTEQEHLNNVFGARLRITALRATTGPGIELLEYLTPGDGRPYSMGAKANDLIHWETTLSVRSATDAVGRLRLARTPFVSAGIVTMPEPRLGFSRAIMVRDPDGHAIRLVEPK